MKAGQWGWKKIMLLWLSIALICAVATVAGYGLLEGVSPKWLAFINAFAGGAILMMLSNTMIPEAFEHGGKLAGVSTVMGFAVSVSIVLLERA
jgi:ZIP family zinc transporter